MAAPSNPIPSMPIRSMTGFAQVKGHVPAPDGPSEATPGKASPEFTLSLKSVNHRFLDIHFRLPNDTDALEMKLRRFFKEKMVRGHLDVTLNVERNGAAGLSWNRELAASYIHAFRAAATEFSLLSEPDLNVILRMPGALESAPLNGNGSMDAALLAAAEAALSALNQMREEEGRGIDRELRQLMSEIQSAVASIRKLGTGMQKAYAEKLRVRMAELLGGSLSQERILQEAALMADRSDIQEEIVRLENHVTHFLGLLDQGGEAGKKLDFLLQEMGREANTLLSKTSGLAGDALQITTQGLALKAIIEKAREQVQNIE